MSLPADPERAGNVWCACCEQSLAASRAVAHLRSQRHADNAAGDEPAAEAAPKAAPTKKKTSAAAPAKAKAAKPPKEAKAPASASDSYTDESEDEAPRPKAKRAPARKAAAAEPAAAPPEPHPADGGKPRRSAGKKAAGLASDPSKPGYSWCGICEVSLAPSLAESHLSTKRHKDAAESYLSAGMRSMKLVPSQ